MEYGIFPPSIKNISNEEIMRGLVVDTFRIITERDEGQIFVCKVHKDVTVPWVIRRNEEQMFIWEVLIDGGVFGPDGRSTISSARTRAFFLLGVVNSRSYS
jgi:hypothetical protein